MPVLVPDDGRDVVADVVASRATAVGVGNGTTEPTSLDTSLESELFRADESDSMVDIKTTSSPGVVRFLVSVAGGTEVSAGSEITELGVFSDDGLLLYRETRPPTSVASGDRVTFEFDLIVG